MEIEPTAESLRGFFTYCPEVFCIADLDGRILVRSEVAARTLGLHSGETAVLADTVHPDDRFAFSAEWAEIVSGSEPARFQCRIRDAEGLYRTFVCSARRSPERGEVYATLSPVPSHAEPPHDATRLPAGSQAANDQTVDAQLRIFRGILDNLPICVWVFNPEGTYTFNDGKGLQTVGLKPGQLVGMNAFKLHALSAETQARFRRALAGEIHHSLSEAYGQWFENWYVPIRDDTGEVAGVAGASLVVTESKRVENELLAKLDLIEKQQAVIRELGTPIIEVWDRVLTLPLMGIVDSRRAAEVMESLLAKIVQSGARYAILDLTGVDTVDTMTANHILQLIRAIRLLGAQGIITGIRPNVAQAMVALGLDLSSIVTLANLREGLKLCMQRMKNAG
jgi:rsbT co-antagonist protein RsbR